MTKPERWQWYGNAGHFICGRWCRFHLCTKVGRYLVSTVGEYVHPSKSGASEKTEAEYLEKHPLGDTIGCDRLFETMVFQAGKACDCGCGMPNIKGSALDYAPANTRKEARAAHMRLCRKWAEK